MSLPHSRLTPLPHSCSCFDVLCDVHQLNTRNHPLCNTPWSYIATNIWNHPKVPRRHSLTVNVQMSNIFPQAHQDFDNPPKQKLETKITNYTDLKLHTYSLVHQHILIPTDRRVCQTPSSLMVWSPIFLIWVEVFWLQMNLLWLIQE